MKNGLLLLLTLGLISATPAHRVEPVLDIKAMLRLKPAEDGPRLRALFPTAKVRHEKPVETWSAFNKNGFGPGRALEMVEIQRIKGEIACVAVTFQHSIPDRVAALALVGLDASKISPSESKVLLRGRWFGLEGLYRVDASAGMGGAENGSDCSIVMVYPSRLALIKAEAAAAR